MPWNRKDYPDDWEAVRAAKMTACEGRCECEGECGLHGPTDKQIDAVANEDGFTLSRTRRCEERHREPAKWAKGTIVLTMAHLNAPGGICTCDPLCSNPEHLRLMCQRCHLRYDRWLHANNVRKRRESKSKQVRLGL